MFAVCQCGPSAPLARECSGIPFRSLQPGQSVPHRLRNLPRTAAASFRIHLPPLAALRCPVCRRKPHRADPASRRYPRHSPSIPPETVTIPPAGNPPASSPFPADFFPQKRPFPQFRAYNYYRDRKTNRRHSWNTRDPFLKSGRN